jgi:hypothetical protein
LTNVAPKGEQNIAGCDFGPSVLSSDFWRSPLQRIYIDCAADIPALNKRHAAGAFGAGLHDPVHDRRACVGYACGSSLSWIICHARMPDASLTFKALRI